MRTRMMQGTAALAALAFSTAWASSHREAPFIAGSPKVDGTDFYLFRSYETGREAFLTLIANYQPLQDTYGGPNYFSMDPDALYEIHIDNNGDAVEDLTFQFRFTNLYAQADIAALGVQDGRVPVEGGPAEGVEVPLVNIGPGQGSDTGALNVVESYTVTLVRGDRRSGTPVAVTNVSDGNATFTKPVDNIGTKSIPDYAGYASRHVYSIAIPGCGEPGRMFVGQRREGFVVNLGQVFDQVNLDPLGARDSAFNTIGDKGVTSLALELPIDCVTNGADPVIGAWTTASLRQARLLNPSPVGPAADSSGVGPARQGGAWTQVSRLGSPLVNEVVIGITDKDKFNASAPKDDVANFGTYVLYPTLPVLVNVLFGVPPPPTPRNDLLAAFVTGITTGPNDTPANFRFTAPADLTTPAEMLRMNTGVPATPLAQQSDLGFLDCDLGGFPNGRRPVDDVVDIALTVAEGALTGTNALQTCDLSGETPTVVNAGAVVNDGARPDPGAYLAAFPYLATPLPGSR